MTWQENMYLSWFDLDQGIGGAHSVRLELNNSGTAWSGLTTTTGQRWRTNRSGIALTAADHTVDRLGAGGVAFVGGPSFGVDVTDDDAEVKLWVDDLYEPLHPWPERARRTVQREAGHEEAAGRIRGSVRLGDAKYDVDALCYRDHSWAHADMSLIASHVWVAGTFGPELSWSAIIYQGVGGQYMRGGSVVRDGELCYADEVDIVTWLEADGVSHRGGQVTLSLPGGEELRITAEAEDAFVFEMGSLVVAEGLCRASVPGRRDTGFCNFEVGTGVGQWRAPITHALRAVTQDGLSQRDDIVRRQ
jgi:hypothetical protein